MKKFWLRRKDQSARAEVSDTSSESDDEPVPPGELKRVWIALMGVTGAGKSTFISHLVDEPVKIGHALKSCTFTTMTLHALNRPDLTCFYV